MILAGASMILSLSISFVTVPTLEPPHLMTFQHGHWNLLSYCTTTRHRLILLWIPQTNLLSRRFPNTSPLSNGILPLVMPLIVVRVRTHSMLFSSYRFPPFLPNTYKIVLVLKQTLLELKCTLRSDVATPPCPPRPERKLNGTPSTPTKHLLPT
jgi:hypothetical protein